jgi:hypothetical protein
MSCATQISSMNNNNKVPPPLPVVIIGKIDKKMPSEIPSKNEYDDNFLLLRLQNSQVVDNLLSMQGLNYKRKFELIVNNNSTQTKDGIFNKLQKNQFIDTKFITDFKEDLKKW